MTPDLPRPVGRRSFLKQTRDEWESWPWDTWNPSQVAHAARTIVLIDDLNRSASASERIKIDQSVRQALRVLGLTKTDDEEDEETQEARKAGDAQQRAERREASIQQQAIRKGVETGDVYLRFLDREGNLRDLRDLLVTDTWDGALEDERQQQAEVDGSWPDAPVQIPIAEGNEAREGTA
jgi:hypothetical protein